MKIPIQRGQILSPVTKDLSGVPCNPHPVEQAVSSAFHVSLSELHQHRRTARIADARQACYELLNEGGWNKTEIAAYLGGRDHSTVCWGITVSHEKAEVDPQYREKLNAARAALRP